MRTSIAPNTTTASRPVVSAAAVYQVTNLDARWQIVRAGNGRIFCICRSQEEANRLATALNHDCELDPKHHLESNHPLKCVGKPRKQRMPSY